MEPETGENGEKEDLIRREDTGGKKKGMSMEAGEQMNSGIA